MKYMKRLALVFSLLFALGAVALVAGLFLLRSYAASSGPLDAEKLVLVPKGASVIAIAEMLEREQVIKNADLFRVVYVLKKQPPLKAGEYAFPAHVSLADTFIKLETGDIFRRLATIPEGLTAHEIIERLNAIEALEGVVETTPPEGSLLPNSYQYSAGDTRQSVIEQMNKAMQAVRAELWPTRRADLPFKTIDEAVILASIVEKETSVPSERARIAGVFVNRLKRGMLLQSDPTIIYGITLGKHQNTGSGPLGRRLLSKDVAADTPYNTYTRAGLPPTPIANPGRDAIAATLQPEQHDYVFFVADGTGGHVFARTLKEHNENVVKWRKIRRDKEAAAKAKAP